MSIIAILQEYGASIFYPTGYIYSDVQFISTVGQHDCFAGIGCIMVPLLFYAALLSKTTVIKALSSIGMLFMAFAVWKTDVDSGKLGMLAGIIALLPYCFNFKISIKKIYGVILILIILFLFVLFFYQGDNLLLYEASELLHGHLSDYAGNLRGYIWKSSSDIILKHPVFGTGPGTFSAAFEPYSAGYMEYSPNTFVDMAHNDFLNIGVCTGIVGLLLYICFICSLLLRFFKSVKNVCSSSVILMSGVIGFLVFSFFGFSIAIISPLFWVILGLLDYQIDQ